VRFRPYIAITLVLILVSTLTGPAVAQEDDEIFSHSIIYKIGGLISIDRQLGHACTTGAVKYQTIKGYGDVTKTETVRMANNILTVDETTDWSVSSDALSGLTVTTVIDLCSRPMSAAAENYDGSPGSDVYEGDIINIYHPLVVNGDLAVNRLTKQLWSTQLLTNPGHSGSYHADLYAAYGPGPYEDRNGVLHAKGVRIYYDEDYQWWFDADEEDGIDRGDYYVGNFFEINQYAATTGGGMRRLISMSNPFENLLFIEELEVTGSAAVREAFSMKILEAGPEAITLAWYELF
jgi:hypothetical protein